MGFFSKLFGAGLGFALGGPIGALIGLVIGSALGGDSSKMLNQGQSQPTYNRKRRSSEGDFKVSLLVLMACVMKADGKVMKSELDVVKHFLLVNFGEEGALEALQILKKLLDQPINDVEVAQQIGMYMNYSTKLELVHLMFEIAKADGDVAQAELSVIQRIASNMGISSADFESVKSPYFKHVDYDWMYKTLEIDSSATDEDVKKAYRRMAMKYHPDKVVGAGEEAKKTATEKFRTINEAYEAIKEKRGIK